MSGWINLKKAFICRSISWYTLIPVESQSGVANGGFWIYLDESFCKSNLITIFCEAGKGFPKKIYFSKDIGGWVLGLPHKRVTEIFTKNTFCFVMFFDVKRENRNLITNVSFPPSPAFYWRQQTNCLVSAHHAQFLKMNTEWNFAAFLRMFLDSILSRFNTKLSRHYNMWLRWCWWLFDMMTI